MAPRSRGTFTLTPGGPEVRVRHLDDDTDAARMADIVATTARMLRSLEDGSMIRLPENPWWQADDLAATCRAEAATYNHHCGTCRMGDPDDPASVVDPDLAVLGTENLFVADSSVIPVIPRSNTNLPSMMIGLRAGRLLSKI
jgi:choline dehydrogenase